MKFTIQSTVNNGTLNFKVITSYELLHKSVKCYSRIRIDLKFQVTDSLDDDSAILTVLLSLGFLH